MTVNRVNPQATFDEIQRIEHEFSVERFAIVELQPTVVVTRQNRQMTTGCAKCSESHESWAVCGRVRHLTRCGPEVAEIAHNNEVIVGFQSMHESRESNAALRAVEAEVNITCKISSHDRIRVQRVRR